MASYFGRYGAGSQPVSLFSAPPAVALGAPPSLALRAPPAVALRGLGATPVVALGAPPSVMLGFGAAEPDPTFYRMCVGEGVLSETECRKRANMPDPTPTTTTTPEVKPEEQKKAEEKTKAWGAQDWAVWFQSFGVFTKPIFDNLGRILDPRTNQPLPIDPAMAQQYQLFLQQQQNKLPSWVVPAAVVGGIAVLALVLLKK